MRDQMEVETRDHQTAMHAMSDFAAARAADGHHTTVMGDLFATMDMQLDHVHCGM